MSDNHMQTKTFIKIEFTSDQRIHSVNQQNGILKLFEVDCRKNHRSKVIRMWFSHKDRVHTNYIHENIRRTNAVYKLCL